MNNFYPSLRTHQATDLRSLVFSAASRFGNKEYLVYKKNGELKSETFVSFSEKTEALGEALIDLGIAGSAIAVIGHTSPEWIMTYLASVNTGSIIVPLDKELAHEEIIGFINKVGCKMIVFDKKFKECFSDPSKFETVEYFVFSDEDPVPEEAVEIPQKGFSGIYQFINYGRKLISTGKNEYRTREINMESVCAIIFTSGTTGSAKGVMLTQKNITASVNAAHNMTEFDVGDVVVSILPLHHTYEMSCGILAPLLIGVKVCINDSLKYLLKNFQLFKPTGLVLVPLFVSTIYKRIWDTAEKKNKTKLLKNSIKISDTLRKIGIDSRKLFFKDISSVFGGRLKRIICGGAPMNAEWVKEFESFGVHLCQGYGITECSPLVAVCPENANRMGSAGLPIPGIEVLIDKTEDEEFGEIMVKGPNVMKGYFKDDDATAEVLSPDGWFRTGDLGYIDKDGFLFITGRKKNVIVLENGKNVFPEEIEEYLDKIDLISECAVVGRENTDKCLVVTALVYPDFKLCESQGLSSLEEIGEEIKKQIAVLNRSLPSFKQIRGIELRKTEFDKTTTKKIKRFNIK